MPLLIGTDEAGYGPNLGPLLVTATAWTLPDDLNPEDLWDQLNACVAQKKSRKGDKLHVADSKQVYSSGKSIRELELGVHAFVRQLKLHCDTLENFGVALSGETFRANYAGVTRNVNLRNHTSSNRGRRCVCGFYGTSSRCALQDADVQLNSVQSRIIFPRRIQSRC